MTRIEKKGNIFYPGIDTGYDRLGKEMEFSLEITEAGTGNIIQNSVPSAEFSEVIMSHSLHSATVLQNANSGRKTFTVQTSNLAVGDRISVNSKLYSIKKVNGATITINGRLSQSLTIGDSITSVGNTGIYKIPVQIDIEGFYFCTIFHKDFGHTAIKYRIDTSDTQDIILELRDISDKIGNKGFL